MKNLETFLKPVLTIYEQPNESKRPEKDKSVP